MNRTLLMAIAVYLASIGFSLRDGSTERAQAGHGCCGCYGYAPPPCAPSYPSPSYPGVVTPRPTDDDSPSDKERRGQLDGAWEIVAIRRDGEETRPAADERFTYTFRGNTIAGFGAQDERTAFRVDTSRQPAHLDIETDEGTARTIFRISGDTLTICLTARDRGRRPSRFKADRADGQVLLILRRVRRGAAKPPITSLVLRVPRDAKVLLAGQATDRTGTRREYHTTELPSGQRWEDYVVRVEVRRGGQTLVKQRKIIFAGGQRHELTFEFDRANVASASK